MNKWVISHYLDADITGPSIPKSGIKQKQQPVNLAFSLSKVIQELTSCLLICFRK